MKPTSYKYQNEEQAIIKAVQQQPGITMSELAEVVAVEFGVSAGAMQSLMSRMLDRSIIYFKRTHQEGKCKYELHPTPVEGTPEELTRIRQPNRAKGAQRVVRKIMQEQREYEPPELPLKHWEPKHLAPMVDAIITPAPAPAPVQERVLEGIPVTVKGITLVIPFTHMRTAYEVLYFVYNNTNVPK